MGVDAAVHTLDEEQDDEMEVTSESQNDLLALLNPIQEASGTIEIAAPIAMMERLTTTEDKQKTEETGASSSSATGELSGMTIEPAGSINTLPIDDSEEILLDSSDESSSFADALSAPTERLNLSDMGAELLDLKPTGPLSKVSENAPEEEAGIPTEPSGSFDDIPHLPNVPPHARTPSGSTVSNAHSGAAEHDDRCPK